MVCMPAARSQSQTLQSTCSFVLLCAQGGWLHKVTAAWQAARVSNFDYLMYLNLAAGEGRAATGAMSSLASVHVPGYRLPNALGLTHAIQHHSCPFEHCRLNGRWRRRSNAGGNRTVATPAVNVACTPERCLALPPHLLTSPAHPTCSPTCSPTRCPLQAGLSTTWLSGLCSPGCSRTGCQTGWTSAIPPTTGTSPSR